MNYLGHAFLSFDNDELLVGNMIGDYVKGMTDIEQYPIGIQKGIMLHRNIDEFADKHPANILAKNIFKLDYGLYAGAVIDVLWDHYLANDPRYFKNEAQLKEMSLNTYQIISKYSAILPAKFSNVFNYMSQENWLYEYRTVKGMEQALSGLAKRAQYMQDGQKAYRLFIQHFYELNQRYYEYIDDAVQFVKAKIN